MKLDYEIVDDYFSDQIFQNINNLVLSNGFPYYYSDGIVDKNNSYFFSHVLCEQNVISSWYYNNIVPHFLKSLGSVDNIFRVKVNAYPKTSTNQIHGFHIDQQQPHLVGIWSANSCNGYTLLRDKNNNMDIKIESVANRMIFFEGSIFHSSVSQTDENLRVNININYSLKNS